MLEYDEFKDFNSNWNCYRFPQNCQNCVIFVLTIYSLSNTFIHFKDIRIIDHFSLALHFFFYFAFNWLNIWSHNLFNQPGDSSQGLRYIQVMWQLNFVLQVISGQYILANISHVNGNITVDGKVNGYKLTRLEPRVLYKSVEQTVTGRITFDGKHVIPD